jgi:hypothetical protein
LINDIASTGRWTARAGALAITFYAVVSIYYLARREPQNLLWACHLACLMVGIGLLASSATWTGIGFLWLALGVPLWALDLARGGELVFPSIFTHVGGLVLGIAGLRTLPLPRGTWWKAAVASVALVLATRLLASPRGNVNVAFGVWSGWESLFPSYPIYLVMLFALFTAAWFALERTIRRMPARAHQPES